MGFFETRRRLRTIFLEAMERSGKISRSGMRAYSMAGIMAMSALPERNSSAHCEGTVKDRSYLPRSGPLVKPQTSGVVFRYCTMEMRSFVTVREVTLRVQYNKGSFSGGNLLVVGILRRVRRIGRG